MTRHRRYPGGWGRAPRWNVALRLQRLGWWGGLAWVLLLGWQTAAVPAESGMSDPHAIIQRMAEAYDGIRDYTAVFLKRERIDGELLPLETIELRFQEPMKVYMAWKDPYAGRAITFVEGENNDKIQVNPGGILGLMRLALDPESAMATRNSHHTVREVGLRNTIELLMQQYQRGMREGKLSMQFHGEDTVDGRPAYRIEFVCDADKDAGYYARRGEIWVDQGHYLPVRLRVYNWADQLYAHYEYHQLRLNPGLEAKAFVLDPVSTAVTPRAAEASSSEP